jgi:diguanylate cyclase (GGDEF)-like protein
MSRASDIPGAADAVETTPARERAQRLLIATTDWAERARLAALFAETRGSEGAAGMAFDIRLAEDLVEAARLWRREHPDLIVLTTSDLSPALALVARIRDEEGPRHTGIVFIDNCALDLGTLSARCLENGADDFARSDCPAAELLARIRAVLRLKAKTDELRSANHQLRRLSLTDELTGLANMRSFNGRFGESLRRCRAGEVGLAVMMLDLDHFKTVNDSTNHLVGSHVLAEIGRLVRESRIFASDETAARYGGDEFVAVFAAADPAEAAARGRRVLQLIAAAEFDKGTAKIKVTASVGVAWVAPGFIGRAEDVVKAADLMLYRSKSAGRNRVSTMVLRYPVDLGDGGSVDVRPEGVTAAAQQQSAIVSEGAVRGVAGVMGRKR